MSNAPQVKPGDWITVGTIDAVVSEVRGIDSAHAELQVLCNVERPTAYEVNWENDAWSFAHPMRGTYAEHLPEVAKYVAILAEQPKRH